MRIVIFGTGNFYLNRRSFFSQEGFKDEIVAFFDNRIAQDEKESFEWRYVYHPIRWKEIAFDAVILMSISWQEMKEQLLALGVASGKILTWEKYTCEQLRNEVCFYTGSQQTGGRRVLIVSTDLGYVGGTIAAVYACRALQSRGYDVWVAAPKGDALFIKEIVENGVNIAIWPALRYMGDQELTWIKGFEIVLVNVFQMLPCAVEISKVRPVLWWIHEPSTLYLPVLRAFSQYTAQKVFENINILAVGNIAKDNFNTHFPMRILNTMAYGIPDRYDIPMSREINGRLVAAVIGVITFRKGQHVLLEAIRQLTIEERNQFEFLIIGAMGEREYVQKVYTLAEGLENVRFLGGVTRKEIASLYARIDVVTAPSLEDPLPIVMTEGMMYGKVCIPSDATGTASYLEDGVSGLICNAGDAESLMKKLRWVLHHRAQLDEMGRRAREIYQRYFTMEKFADRLEDQLRKTECAYIQKECI